MNYLQMDKKLKESLDEKRYIHSKGVEEFSVLLAEKWGADVEKTRISALLHDSAKMKSKEFLEEKIKTVTCDPEILENAALWHGPVGAGLLKEDYGIEDEEIYNAVFYHTTGRKNMSLIERIIYISDLIEPTRDAYLGWAKKCRELAVKNLDKALLEVTDRTLLHLKEKGVKINSAIYDIREDCLGRLNKNQEEII